MDKKELTEINEQVFKRKQNNIIILSYDSSINLSNLIAFSFIPNFFDSTFISNNSIQVLSIPLVSYPTIKIKKETIYNI